MSVQTASIVIHRRPRDVFAYMDDVSREHEWQPSLESAGQEPEGPTRVGTRKRYVSTFMGRRVDNTYVVVELDPGRKIVCRTTADSAADVRSEVLCEEEGGATRVTMTVDGRPRGALRMIPGKALRAVYRDQLDETLERLKRVLESGGS